MNPEQIQATHARNVDGDGRPTTCRTCGWASDLHVETDPDDPISLLHPVAIDTREQPEGGET